MSLSMMPGRPRMRRLVPAQLRALALVAAGLAAAAVMVMGVRYSGGERGGRVDRIFSSRSELSARGSDFRWILERLIDLGNPVPAAGLAVLVGLAALLAGRWSGFLLAALGPAVAVFIAQFLLKPLVGRTDEDGLVFPSGHATVFSAIAGVVAVLLLNARWPRRWVHRAWLVAGVALLVVAKTAALAATGYHYVTDGIGGACLAISVVLVIALALDEAELRVRRMLRVPSRA